MHHLHLIAMPNLKDISSMHKSMIGKYLFKATRTKACLSRHWNKGKYIDLFGRDLKEEQAEFLLKNWFLLDCIEMKGQQPIIFDVQTRSTGQVSSSRKDTSRIDDKKKELYTQAQEKGFRIYCADVALEDDWNYTITLRKIKRDDLRGNQKR